MSGIIVAVALIAALVVFTDARLGGTRIIHSGQELRIEMVGLDKLWALRSRVVVPTSAIRDVRVAERRSLRVGWRWPGTAIPGRIISGTYRRSGVKAFWNVHRADRVLVVDLDGAAFSTIVVEVDDPDQIAADVQVRLKSVS